MSCPRKIVEILNLRVSSNFGIAAASCGLFASTLRMLMSMPSFCVVSARPTEKAYRLEDAQIERPRHELVQKEEAEPVATSADL
eukprot:CAMPEP_0179977610 /NCGR_PEP_ID=MMETSP0983-20121128/40180_1 /TAXON_ID=483367 /ORGANISM="non described non described, Strain CCMP 2436" /LENGTH=83 /DNA_ID=CAMNT_0021894867 /DNA_START=125 /DNA_END=377 /DNA_ORIENTATION=+